MPNGPHLGHTSAWYFSRDGTHRIFFFRCTCMHVNCEVIIMHRSSYSARERSWSLAIDGAHRSPYACSLIIRRRAYSFCSVMALSLCLFRYEVVRHRTSSPLICPILLGVLGLIIILNNTEAHFAVSRDHYTDRCMHRDVYIADKLLRHTATGSYYYDRSNRHPVSYHKTISLESYNPTICMLYLPCTALQLHKG